MKGLSFVLVAVLAAAQLTACASESDVSRWDEGDIEDSASPTGEMEQELLSGGGLSYSCSATRCECNPDASRDSMGTCIGMRDVCNRAGKTVTCSYPPGGPNECHCDLAVQSPTARAPRVAIIGGSVAAVR